MLAYLHPVFVETDDADEAPPDQAEGVEAVLPLAGQPVDDGAGLANQFDENEGIKVAPIADNIKRNKGDVFYYPKGEGQEMVLWHALENTNAGDNPSDPKYSDLFMEISKFPNGQVVETKKTFSDLESFKKGDQIYYEGKLYQANADLPRYQLRPRRG